MCMLFGIPILIILVLFAVDYLFNETVEEDKKNQKYTGIKDDPQLDNNLPF